MPDRRVIVTMAIGDAWASVAAISHPTFRAYAEKVGADFRVIDRRRIGAPHIHWEKLQLSRIIAAYNRALYVDSDAIIHPDAPDVFDLVPRGSFGAWSEGELFDRGADVNGVTAFYGRKAFDSRRFFNAGVFLVERDHRKLLEPPTTFYGGVNPEQAYLNMVFADVQRCDLGREWDLFPDLRQPGGAYSILHFAAVSGNIGRLVARMRGEVASWK
jgi:hypothetical protein